MEDRLQSTTSTPQHSQEVTAEEEQTGPDHKSEMCIGWNNVTLLRGVVTGITITMVTSHWNDTAIVRYEL